MSDEEMTKELVLVRKELIKAKQELVKADRERFPSGQEKMDINEAIKEMKDTPFMTKLGGPGMARVAIFIGREMGIAPMMSIRGFHNVQGNMVMSSDLMRTQLRVHGHSLTKVIHNGEVCHLKGKRNDKSGDEWEEIFTMEDAKKALLLNKDNWKKHPKDMLLASCTRKLCRALFGDVFSGTIPPDDFDEEIVVQGRVVEEKKVVPVPVSVFDEKTSSFVEKYNLHNLDSDMSKFIDGIAINRKMERGDVLVEVAAREGKFLEAFDKFSSSLDPK